MALKTFKYDGSTVYVIPGVRFTDDIARDVARMEQDEDAASWLWGELQSNEGITDKARRIIYWGADVQDHLDRSHLSGSELRKKSDVVSVDALAKMFDLPEWEEIQELNWEHDANAGHYAYQQAIEDGDDEDDAEEAREKAEGEAQDEIYQQWYDGVTSAAEQLFEAHALELEPYGKQGSTEYSYELKVVPEVKGQKGWRKAAEAIMETLGGVGDMYFRSLDDFLDSGPYTPREAVLSHLAYISYYPEVYGAHTARSIYENAWR